jgi:hypothetical protein
LSLEVYMSNRKWVRVPYSDTEIVLQAPQECLEELHDFLDSMPLHHMDAVPDWLLDLQTTLDDRDGDLSYLQYLH